MAVSLMPELPGWVLPSAASTPGLSEDEENWISGLATRLSLQSAQMRIRRSYYEGTQRLQDLGVAIPPQLSAVRTVVDWPRIAVDPLVQRCVVDGFRLPGDTDANDELLSIWQANNMDAEAPLAFLDSLVCGRGYIVVGAPDDSTGAPIITVESPFNMAVQWDPRNRAVTAAYQAYEAEGIYRAALYLPDQTIYMSMSQSKSWTVDERDIHNFGQVPVVRLPNRARSDLREGMSEITPAIMSTTDSTCRTLLAMEVAREFYAVPHRYILGATEADFMNTDGTPKTALDMVMSKFLAFERDDEGQAPSVGQFTAFDPSVFTKIVDKHGQLMASYTQFPPEWFSQIAGSNPASADAIRSAQDGVNRRASQVQQQFSDPLEDVMRLAWRFANDGAPIPDAFMQMETDWVDVATPSPTATSDAIAKQVEAGIIPAASSVALKRLGYSAVERDQLGQDRAVDAGDSLLLELAHSLTAKAAKVDKSLTADIGTGAEPLDALSGSGNDNNA